MSEILETIGRAGVLLTMVLTLNRTEWYQSLPVQNIHNTEPITYLICLGIVLSLIWVFVPLFAEQLKYKEVRA